MRKQNVTQKTNRQIAFIFITFILLFIIIGSITAKGNSTENTVLYKSVLVQDGDTFWTIAKEYNNLDIDNDDYIEKLQQMNKTSGHDIRPGDYVVVAYYE